MTGDRATDITRHDATSVTSDCTVRVRLELDELALSFILDGERASAILRTAFRIADLEHLVQGDCLLGRRPQLLYLLEDEVHIMVTTRTDTWAESVEVFAGLDYQQADGNRSRGVWSVKATGRESVVRPTAPCEIH